MYCRRSTVANSNVDEAEDVYQLLATYEKGKNCSLNLTIPALLAMTANLCGLNTRIEGQEMAFKRP